MKYLTVFIALVFSTVAQGELTYRFTEYDQSAEWTVEQYPFSFDGGTLITDGEVGRLAKENIIDWDFEITTQSGTHQFTPDNSVLELSNQVPVGRHSLDTDIQGITTSPTPDHNALPTDDPSHDFELSFTLPESFIAVWWSDGIDGPLLNMRDWTGPFVTNRLPLPASSNNVAVIVPEPSNPVVFFLGFLVCLVRRRPTLSGPCAM